MLAAAEGEAGLHWLEEPELHQPCAIGLGAAEAVLVFLQQAQHRAKVVRPRAVGVEQPLAPPGLVAAGEGLVDVQGEGGAGLVLAEDEGVAADEGRDVAAEPAAVRAYSATPR